MNHTAQHTQHVQHAQGHTQSRSQNHGAQRDNHGRRDVRTFDAGTHHRINDRRFHNDREEIGFEGYWFGCDFWPGWIYSEDVYFAMGPNNVWFVYQYGNPAYMVQVELVD
jgi:hypothetical protein